MKERERERKRERKKYWTRERERHRRKHLARPPSTFFFLPLAAARARALSIHRRRLFGFRNAQPSLPGVIQRGFEGGTAGERERERDADATLRESDSLSPRRRLFATDTGCPPTCSARASAFSSFRTAELLRGLPHRGCASRVFFFNFFI